VILDIGLMREADRARVREIAEATGLTLQFHFVDAPQAV
jgi:predicted kinase